MTTSFQTLPIIDLSPILKHTRPSYDEDDDIDLDPSSPAVISLASTLTRVLETVGFAYLVGTSLDVDEQARCLEAAKAFFKLGLEEKMALATRRFRRANGNSYRGYFPVQEGQTSHKE
ncbi:hypothetical protein HK101_003425, partial [Irineochytrium annulatum]